MKTLSLYKLELYQIARELSRMGWRIYSKLSKQFQYHIGDQFLGAIDSVQANIAEGHGRFHFKDKMKFGFNARGSLYEALSWSEILLERELISPADQEQFAQLCIRVSYLLNGHIRYLYQKANDGTTPSSRSSRS